MPCCAMNISVIQWDWLGPKETQEKDVWKFITTELGELCVMTISTTLQQRLLATDSASGISPIYYVQKILARSHFGGIRE